MRQYYYYLFIFTLIMMHSNCQNKEDTAQHTTMQVGDDQKPYWSNATIYEVNIRCYTPEGTFKAFESHLDRLEQLGVDILWLMPIHPIGLLNRKGSLGSYYSIRDYQEINPEYGTRDDFAHLVESIHSKGMKIIIDWVANHTAWDHQWIQDHPEWYRADAEGNRPTVPFDANGNSTDWTDVAGLDYDQPALRTAMTEAMRYWVEQYDIDGFRCDVADWVPTGFWRECIAQLRSVKPDLFMLAESDNLDLIHAGFNMDYEWKTHHLLDQIAKHESEVAVLCNRLEELNRSYQGDKLKMQFLTNHDENSWNGTIVNRFGQYADAMAVLIFTLPGMPLIYSGQEVGMSKMLAFFDKDDIDWTDQGQRDFYRRLVDLKKSYAPLWNAGYGGSMKIELCSDGQVIYSRDKEEQTIVVMLNFSSENESFSPPSAGQSYKILLSSDSSYAGSVDQNVDLAPGGYMVLSAQ